VSDILGLSFGHDAGATLLRDGDIVAAVNEERFTRRKHAASYPLESISYCLEAADITAAEVDVLAVPSEGNLGSLDPFVNDYEVVNASQDPTSFLSRLRRLSDRPESLVTRAYNSALRRLAADTTPRTVVPDYVFDQSFQPGIEARKVNHHEAHASTAYFGCGDPEALVVTADGIGDELTTTVWDCRDGEMEPLRKWGRKGSLGWFFGVVTEALGWWIGNGEGKTMGLGSYGEYDEEIGRELREILPEYEDGELVDGTEFSLPSSFEIHNTLHWSFSESDHVEAIIDEHGREDVAATAQRLLEEQILNIVEPWMERTGHETLATAGGVFLNVRVNNRIIRSETADSYFIFPNAGDGGLPTGAALTAHRYETPSFTPFTLEHPYFGVDIGRNLPAELEKRELPYEKPSSPVDRAVELLVDGNIVAWCQGRMEYGPRALGNRSILIDPTEDDSMDRVNQSVKFRESWRPFAPSILEEAVDEYLLDPVYDPFMITSFDVRGGKRDEIPAVTHVDGTTRPQVVRKSVNERYWTLINRFGEETGTPVLLNTSFNLSGDPIVATPKDAIHTFYNSGLDALVLGDYVLTK